MKEHLAMTPAMVLAEATGLGVAAGTPGAIKASEAAGQVAMVSSEILPVDMTPDQAAITAGVGIVFGDMADDIFINATLPEGWRKQATDHSMHSDILDDKGRTRAGIFYKAAFYDRHAHMHFNRFYSIGGDFEKGEIQVINANGAIIKDFGCAPYPGPDEDDAARRVAWDKKDKLNQEARVWLADAYPEHDDPFAYWD